MHELKINSTSFACLGDEVADIYLKKFGPVDYVHGISQASTDFVSGKSERHII